MSRTVFYLNIQIRGHINYRSFLGLNRMWFLGFQSCNCNIMNVLLTFNCCSSLDLHTTYRVLLSGEAQLWLGVWMTLLSCSSMWAFTIKRTPNCRCDRATSERADWPSSQGDAAERGNLYIFINQRKCIILLIQGNNIQRNLTAMEPQYSVLSLDCKPSFSTRPCYSFFYHKRESFNLLDFFLSWRISYLLWRFVYFLLGLIISNSFYTDSSISQEIPWNTPK